MTDNTTGTSPQVLAKIAGFLYLSLIPLGIFGILYVPATLIVAGDAAATANNIRASELLFRSGIVSSLLTQIIFILLVLFLYRLLKPVSKSNAMLMAVFALVGVPLAMLNEINQFAALLLLSGADYLTAFDPDQLQTQVLLFLNLHKHGIFIAQIYWGLWLFPLGYLIFKSGFLPGILGVLLMIGCFGYVIDSAIFFLFPDFSVNISQYTFIGELLLPLWLVIKGVDVEVWHKSALESA